MIIDSDLKRDGSVSLGFLFCWINLHLKFNEPVVARIGQYLPVAPTLTHLKTPFHFFLVLQAMLSCHLELLLIN